MGPGRTFESVKVFAILDKVHYFKNTLFAVNVLFNWLIDCKLFAVDEVSVSPSKLAGVPFWRRDHLEYSGITDQLFSLFEVRTKTLLKLLDCRLKHRTIPDVFQVHGVVTFRI